METKDWIIMLVPIVINGFLIFIFQSTYTKHLRKTERENMFLNDTLRILYDKLQNLNTGIFEVAVKEQNFELLEKSVQNTEELMLDLMAFQKGNYFQLSKFDKFFEKLNNDWKASVKIWDDFKKHIPEINTDYKEKNAIKREYAEKLIKYVKAVAEWHNMADYLKLLISNNVY